MYDNIFVFSSVRAAAGGHPGTDTGSRRRLTGSDLVWACRHRPHQGHKLCEEKGERCFTNLPFLEGHTWVFLMWPTCCPAHTNPDLRCFQTSNTDEATSFILFLRIEIALNFLLEFFAWSVPLFAMNSYSFSSRVGEQKWPSLVRPFKKSWLIIMWQL